MTDHNQAMRAACPNCGLAFSTDTVICTACGCHTKTGKLIQTGSTKPTPPKKQAQTQSHNTSNIIAIFIFPLIGAGIFAAISAAAWYAMVYYSGYELGIAAAGVGALCGIGAMMGSPDDGNWWTGSIAVVAALLAIYTAKFALFGPGVTNAFNFYDAIWALFAVAAAWHIGSGQYGD
jgi:hypothetical protein